MYILKTKLLLSFIFLNRQHAQLAGTVSGHGSWVLSVAVSPDNERFVSGSSDRTVKVWDMKAKQCLHTFNDHTDQVSFSSQFLASSIINDLTN